MKVTATETKSCSVCREAGRHHIKPVGDFHQDKSNLSGLRAACKACEAAKRKARGKAARESVHAAIDDFEVTWEEPADLPADVDATQPRPVTQEVASSPSKMAGNVPIQPLPPPVDRQWHPSDGLDMGGPGMPREGMKRVLAIGDLHLPWHSHRGVRLLLEYLDRHRFDVVVQMGDFYDLLAASKYPRSLNLLTPRDETDEARRWGVWLWAEVRKRQPKARLVQLFGNHDARPQKRVLEVLPAIEHLTEPTLRALFTFEGVELIFDARAELEIDGVLYHHGHRTFGNHLTWNLQPTVNGHLHRGGVIYRQTQRGAIWELNAGWLGDARAPCFGYVPQKRIHGTTAGWGVVDEYGPRFVTID